MNDLDRITRGLRRRSLWQILALYLVVSWVSLEVVTTLTEALGLPEWAPAFGFALLVLGFPIVLAVALVEGRRGDAVDAAKEWEGTDRREERADSRAPSAGGEDRKPVPPDPDPGRVGGDAGGGSGIIRPHRVFTWRNAAYGGFGALGIWVLAATGWSYFGPGPADGPAAGVEERRAIAALPFANLSIDEEDRYFADGIHEEILTQLARIDALRVISRTSVMGYRDTDRRLGEIAGELGVRYVLEGSVRRGGDQVRITAQLIDATTDEHLWAETYDRPRADLLAIQSDVATRIAEALHAELSPEERRRIDARPTEDPEAYDLYLRARDLYWSGGAAARDQQARDWRVGIDLLERAVDRDPDFALAWANLGILHIELLWFGHDLSESRREAAQRAAERALQEDPDLPEAHLAMGWVHYHGRRDYDAAVREAEIARRGLPSDPEVLLLLAAVERRRGNFDVALRRFEEASRLDPRNPTLVWEVANTSISLHRWDEAQSRLDDVERLAPAWGVPYGMRAAVAVASAGDTAHARIILAEWERLNDGEVGLDILPLAVVVDIQSREYERALERLRPWSSDALYDLQEDILSPALLRAGVHRHAGRLAEARAEAGTALPLLRDWATNHPGFPGPLRRVAEAHAMLGDAEEALDALGRARVLLPVERDRWAGPRTLQSEVTVRVLLGDDDGAVAALERLWDSPGNISVTGHLLRLDPLYDPLRGHPRFRALLQRVEAAPSRADAPVAAP